MSEQKLRLIDSLPLKKHSLPCEDGTFIEVVKVQDVEDFLQKFTDPAVLNKIVKSLMFGQKLNFEDVLK